jgi:NADP-dependent alcohol dehydrogenase
MKALVQLGRSFEQHNQLAWQQNLMWAANQAWCGILGVGVPQDWATHRIAVELTALWDIDHGRTLSIIQPWLLRELIEYKRVKLEQLGRNVFGLANPSAEDSIAALEAFYRHLNMPLHLRDAGIAEADAATRVMDALRTHGKAALGGHAQIDEAKTERILRAACS